MVISLLLPIVLLCFVCPVVDAMEFWKLCVGGLVGILLSALLVLCIDVALLFQGILRISSVSSAFFLYMGCGASVCDF